MAFDVAAVLAVQVPRAGALDALVLTSACVVAFVLLGLYRPRLTLRALDDTPRLLVAIAVVLLAQSPSLLMEGRTLFVLELSLVLLAVLVGRVSSTAMLRHLRRRGVLSERTVIIGAGHLGVELARLLSDRPEHGLQPVGFVDALLDVRESELPLPMLGTVDQLDDVLRKHQVRRVVVAFGRVREAQWVGIMRSAIYNDVEVHVVPRFFDIGVGARDHNVDEVWGIPLYRVRRAALRSKGWWVKRTIDVAVAAVGLLLLLPLLAMLALLVRTTGPQVLYRQVRIGQHGRNFEVLKFRSLRQDHDGHGTWNAATAASDERTWIGRLMRQSSLDELPQLFNVLRGDMSLVGPRPERPHFAHRFGTDIPGYQDRHRLPVGLTGWAQVNGLRGDTSIAQRARFDNFYVERWSLWFDLVILLRTIPAVLRDAGRSER